MSCPNCSCWECVSSRVSPFRQTQIPQTVGARQPDDECAFDRIRRDYQERNIPMPTGWLLYCGCKRCNPITW